MIYSFWCTSFHHVNTKRRFNFPLVTASIIYVCSQPCNLLPRCLSAAADPFLEPGSVRHHNPTVSAQRSPHTHTHTHTRICYQTEHYRWCIWVTELYFFPPTENSWVSCFDYSHENSKKQNPDADLQRQLSQVLPAVGGCRVHGSEINPTKETQQSESAQGLFHSAVIQLNKEGAWTHRCSLITHGARLHRTSVTWRSVSRCPRGSPLISTSWWVFFVLLSPPLGWWQLFF